MRVPETLSELRATCQTGPAWMADQTWGFLLIRRVSLYLTWLLLHTPISANGVTVLGILLGMAGGVAFGMTAFGVGAMAIVLSMICDFSDGEVARYRKQQSKQGSFLDKVYHFTVHPAVFAGLTLGAYRLHPSFVVLTAGLIATVCVPAFGIVVGYGNDLAVWKHSRKLIERLNTALSATPPDPSALDAMMAGLHDNGHPRRATPPGQRSISERITDLVGYWDFPYIFWVMVAATIVNTFTGPRVVGGRLFTAFDVVLLFYAATYPLWIIVYLVHVLATRATERGYSAFSDELSQLLSSAIRVAGTKG